MNRNDLFDTLATVDLWSQLSCLGSMQYATSAEAIRRAMKLIPDNPTPETMEDFFNEERNIKLDIEFAGRDENGELVAKTLVSDVETTPGNYFEQRRELQALLDLRADLVERGVAVAEQLKLDEVEERGLLNTLRFMETQQAIDKVKYARQYMANMKLGMKNYGQTRAEYVEQETVRALEAIEQFAAKGELAVQFLDGLDPLDGLLDERFIEGLAKRCVSKLILRRIKIGQSLSYRSDIDQRVDAETDIGFIESAIVEFGGTVPKECVVPDEAPVEVVAQPTANPMIEQFTQWLASQNQDPRKPGPVTTIRH